MCKYVCIYICNLKIRAYSQTDQSKQAKVSKSHAKTQIYAIALKVNFSKCVNVCIYICNLKIRAYSQTDQSKQAKLSKSHAKTQIYAIALKVNFS